MADAVGLDDEPVVPGSLVGVVPRRPCVADHLAVVLDHDEVPLRIAVVEVRVLLRDAGERGHLAVAVGEDARIPERDHARQVGVGPATEEVLGLGDLATVVAIRSLGDGTFRFS